MTLLLRPRECSLRQRRQRSNCWKQHLAEKCILQQCIGLFAAVFTCPCFLIGAGGYPKSGRAKTKCSCCSCFAGRVVDSTRSTFLAFWPRRPKRANMVWRSKHGEVNSLCCSVGLFVTARYPGICLPDLQSHCMGTWRAIRDRDHVQQSYILHGTREPITIDIPAVRIRFQHSAARNQGLSLLGLFNFAGPFLRFEACRAGTASSVFFSP